jgi:hypothetical protein
MKKLLFAGAFLSMFMASLIARADEAADKAQLREIEKRTVAALVDRNFQALGNIFAEEWMLIGSEGQVLSRQQIFEQLRSGELKFSKYELGEMEIRIFGDTAVVVGHGNPHGEYKGEKFEQDEVFSDTFIRAGEKWRCVLTHSSQVAK